MRTNTLRRTAAAGSILALSLTMAACGGSSEGDSTPAAAEESTSAPATPDASESTPAETTNAGDQTFGEGCAAVPADGAGSFNGMATAPVASAASANPLLSTLVTAVTKAGLVDTLNSQEALTVFAPTNDAFAKLPPKTLKAVLADKALLTKILTHHVIAGQLTPEQLAGPHETLAGDMLKVKGSGESFKVVPDKASVICGNVPTANATVYIIDTVLMPS
ncbi:fasciclin domain-containing protein [Nocardioides sp.]|uniref:fasciclin domain-containing protein n=1 Tax=Nocardioides sp. TaxID=35761 RepID=UPI003D0A8EBB